MIHTPGNNFRLHLLTTAGFSLNGNFLYTVIVSYAWEINSYRTPGVFARYLLFFPMPVFAVLNKARSMELPAITQYMNRHYNIDDMDYEEPAERVRHPRKGKLALCSKTGWR
jgi:hypothetical protein